MKKIVILFAAVISSAVLFAEAIPAGYYSAIDGKQDSVLKSTLSQIIYPIGDEAIGQTSSKPNFINVEYQAGRRYKYGTRAVNEVHEHHYTWDGFIYTDTREDGSVWDMYSNYIHYMAPDTLGAVSIPDLEIEHCFPKGWWGGNTNNQNDAFMDLHHLNPANARANNNKSDYPPGYVVDNIKYDNGIFKLGKNNAYGTFYVFEPCDEYKGDFARAYFYIVTAYEQFVWKCSYLTNDSYLEFQPWLLQVLLEWHRLDPVSEKEITRHDRVSDLQHNRNPFIDYPDLVEYIWGNKQNMAVDLSQLTFTGSDEYELPVETMVSRALPATGITTSGFTANWKDAGKSSYELDVYTTNTTGSNDTLLNVPYFNSKTIQSDTQHFSYTGSFGTTGIGKNSATFGTKTNPLKVTIKGLTIPANSRIVVRALAPLKVNDTDGAQMKISANGTQIALQTLTNDEVYYSYSVPAGTSTILIEQGNGKLFNIQQLFIITGNEVTTHTSLPGYPKIVSGTSDDVVTTMDENTVLYYTIKPDGLKTSAPIQVTYSTPTGVSNTGAAESAARKEMRDGRVVIIRNSSIYTPLGQQIR